MVGAVHSIASPVQCVAVYELPWYVEVLIWDTPNTRAWTSAAHTEMSAFDVVPRLTTSNTSVLTPRRYYFVSTLFDGLVDLVGWDDNQRITSALVSIPEFHDFEQPLLYGGGSGIHPGCVVAPELP